MTKAYLLPLLLTKFTLSLLLLFSSYCHSDAMSDVLDREAFITPLATNAAVFDISQTGNRLIAVGVRGHILISDDDGASWSQSHVPVSVDLTAVHFVDDKYGWAVGHDSVILNTTDGGQHWVKQFDGRQLPELMRNYYGQLHHKYPDNENYTRLLNEAELVGQNGTLGPLLDVYFVNRERGYVVGAFNQLLTTLDGGTSWQPLMEKTSNPYSYHLNALGVIGERMLIAGEQGLLLNMNLLTQKISPLVSPYDGTFFSIATDEQGVCISGLRGHLYCSDAITERWTRVDTHLQVSLSWVSFVEQQLLVGSQAGHVLLFNRNRQQFSLLRQLQVAGPVTSLVPANKYLVITGLKGIFTQSRTVL